MVGRELRQDHGALQHPPPPPSIHPSLHSSIRIRGPQKTTHFLDSFETPIFNLSYNFLRSRMRNLPRRNPSRPPFPKIVSRKFLERRGALPWKVIRRGRANLSRKMKRENGWSRTSLEFILLLEPQRAVDASSGECG